jgi:hypothetical protein
MYFTMYSVLSLLCSVYCTVVYCTVPWYCAVSVLYLFLISAMSQRDLNRNSAVLNTLMRINKKAEYFFCKFFTRLLDKRWREQQPIHLKCRLNKLTIRTVPYPIVIITNWTGLLLGKFFNRFKPKY